MPTDDDKKAISRRAFVKASGLAGTAAFLAACAPGATPSPTDVPAPTEAEAPEAEPTEAMEPTEELPYWAAEPTAPKPEKLVAVVWAFGAIYDDLAERFERDWGVPVELIVAPNVEEQITQLTSKFAAGEQIDCGVALHTSLGQYVNDQMLLALDDMPGFAEYQNDFTPIVEQSMSLAGKHYGMPYFSAVWMNWYYGAKLEEAGIDAPFTTWEECVDQCLKAKTDGVSNYPLIWAAGVGMEQLPGTWYNLTWNRGGVWFDKDHTPQFGPGSVARETLEWWRSTFVDLQISDPRSLEVRFIPAAQAFSTGEYLYHPVTQFYYITTPNDPEVSPIAGDVDVFLMPGDHKSLGFGQPYTMMSSTVEPAWAWMLLQAMGGRSKNGEYTQAYSVAEGSMLGTGFKSVMESDRLKQAWQKWGTPETVAEQYTYGSDTKECVPVLHEPWFPRWLVGVENSVNNLVQACLRGEITADECCDNIVDLGIPEAQQSV